MYDVQAQESQGNLARVIPANARTDKIRSVTRPDPIVNDASDRSLLAKGITVTLCLFGGRKMGTKSGNHLKK